MKQSKRALSLFVSISLVLASVATVTVTAAAQPETRPPVQAPPPPPLDDVAAVQPSADTMDQLVAPIALYPDALVAQILAAATYPTQVVEADRWMQQNPDLKADALAQAVDPQSWDASVKALTQFPSVLEMMDKNLSWTSSLGDAYANWQQDVMDAVQAMRQRAQQAGNLESTQQETVTTDADTIAIEPADAQVVYVPQYDPWTVYGDSLAFYPDWYQVPGLFVDGPGIEFGLGIGIGVFGGYGWGWPHWGTDWHHHDVTHDHGRYVSHSPTFNHHDFGHGPATIARPGGFPRGSGATHAAGFTYPGSLPAGGGVVHRGGFSGAPYAIHSGAFSGFNHGGVTSGFSSRGRSSFGGGSHAHAGGFAGSGGFHGGGGFHAGGGHR
jgi:uncharacterized membrane protein YgcG